MFILATLFSVLLSASADNSTNGSNVTVGSFFPPLTPEFDGIVKCAGRMTDIADAAKNCIHDNDGIISCIVNSPAVADWGENCCHDICSSSALCAQNGFVWMMIKSMPAVQGVVLGCRICKDLKKCA